MSAPLRVGEFVKIRGRGPTPALARVARIGNGKGGEPWHVTVRYYPSLTVARVNRMAVIRLDAITQLGLLV